MLASEACRCEIYVFFTWQAEQDRDTLLSSSVRISCFRTFSWFPPPLIAPSSSLPPPFTRWLLMSSKVWSWTWTSHKPNDEFPTLTLQIKTVVKYWNLCLPVSCCTNGPAWFGCCWLFPSCVAELSQQGRWPRSELTCTEEELRLYHEKEAHVR